MFKASYNEHIFVTNVVDNGSSAVFKNDGDITSDDEEMATFKVYPNPANSLITITSTTATLYNTVGQAVAHIPVSQHKQTINVAHLPPGLYIVQVHYNGNTLLTEKVIIKR